MKENCAGFAPKSWIFFPGMVTIYTNTGGLEIEF